MRESVCGRDNTHNKNIREAVMQVAEAAAIIKAGGIANSKGDLVEIIAEGLQDNWSQVRFAAA
jgi:hypothetical protein